MVKTLWILSSRMSTPCRRFGCPLSRLATPVLVKVKALVRLTNPSVVGDPGILPLEAGEGLGGCRHQGR